MQLYNTSSYFDNFRHYSTASVTAEKLNHFRGKVNYYILIKYYEAQRYFLWNNMLNNVTCMKCKLNGVHFEFMLT